jgi:hypothetical protein
MNQENTDFRTELLEGEQVEKQLDRTLIPMIGRLFKNINVSICRENMTDNSEHVTFWYHRTPFPLSYVFSRDDNLNISFYLCDLERIEVTSNIKKRHEKEFLFVFKQGIVQLKVFRHLFRRSEHIYVRIRNSIETGLR